MNELSIIINGVRYDAVEPEGLPFPSCSECDIPTGQACGICSVSIIFKKSTKSFER